MWTLNAIGSRAWQRQNLGGSRHGRKHIYVELGTDLGISFTHGFFISCFPLFSCSLGFKVSMCPDRPMTKPAITECPAPITGTFFSFYDLNTIHQVIHLDIYSCFHHRLNSHPPWLRENHPNDLLCRDQDASGCIRWCLRCCQR